MDKRLRCEVWLRTRLIESGFCWQLILGLGQFILRHSHTQPSGTTASTPVATTTTSGRTPPATNTTPQSMTGTGGGAGPPPAFDPFGGPQEDLQQQMQYVQQVHHYSTGLRIHMTSDCSTRTHTHVHTLTHPHTRTQQFDSHPEMMQQLMESPMIQNFLSNPDALQAVLTSNPQMQQLMEVSEWLSLVRCICCTVHLTV